MRAGAPIAGLAGKAFLTPGLGGRSGELEQDGTAPADDPAGAMPPGG